MADTTVYGRIHTSIDSMTGASAAGVNEEKLSVNSNSSRFGVKGSEDLGGGLKAIYQIESSVSANGNGGNVFNGVRDTYIGLTGGFGTFLTGRLGLANQYVYDSNLFADQIGDAANFTEALPGGRVNGALHYVTPDMSGFNASLSFVPGTSVEKSAVDKGILSSYLNTASQHGKNSYAMKLNYAANGITANLFYADVEAVIGATNSGVEFKPLSIAGSYDFGNGMVSAQYVKANLDVIVAGATTSADRNIWNIGGKFNVASNAAIKAQYSHASSVDNLPNTGAKMWAIGYDYALSKRTGVYVAYASVTNDGDNTGPATGGAYSVSGYGHEGVTPTGLVQGDDPKGISFGLTHNF
jgi:predicted porin